MSAPLRGERLDRRHLGLLIPSRRRIEHTRQRLPAVLAFLREQVDELVDLRLRHQLAVSALVSCLCTTLALLLLLLLPVSALPSLLRRIARWRPMRIAR